MFDGYFYFTKSTVQNVLKEADAVAGLNTTNFEDFNFVVLPDVGQVFYIRHDLNLESEGRI
jgi:hypothetical protein